jgi:DNA-binding MarR family transcriptional regulator
VAEPVPSSEPNLAVLLEAVDAAMVRHLHDDLERHGHGAIRPAHGVVFSYIGQHGARLTDIADAGGLTKQAVGYLVDHLEAHGYCERVADPADRRAKIVRLTDKGWEAVQVAEASLRRTERRWADEIGESRLRAIRRGLAAIADGEDRRAADR